MSIKRTTTVEYTIEQVKEILCSNARLPRGTTELIVVHSNDFIEMVKLVHREGFDEKPIPSGPIPR
jgi:hypothetical protein